MYGDRRRGALTRLCSIPVSMRGSGGIRASIAASTAVVGVAGAGAAGDGLQTGTAGISIWIIPSLIATVSGISREEDRWGIQRGCTIRNTGSVYLMLIARWRAASRARAPSAVARPGDSELAAFRDSIGVSRHLSSASEIRHLSSAAGREVTACSAVITMVGWRACKATAAFQAWEPGAPSADSAEGCAVADLVVAACAAEGGGSHD